MSEESLDEIKEEAKDLGAFSPASKIIATVLEAPTTFKKAILYSLPIYATFMIGAPNNGFRGAVSIYFAVYLGSVLLLPLVKGKQSIILKILHVIIAIMYILSLAFIGVMFFALLGLSLVSILGRFGVPQDLAAYMVAILCVLVIMTYKVIKKK